MGQQIVIEDVQRQQRLPLNDLERRLLVLMACGYSINDTSEELSISEHVINHINALICKKLHANNLGHAIALSLRDGVISDADIK